MNHFAPELAVLWFSILNARSQLFVDPSRNILTELLNLHMGSFKYLNEKENFLIIESMCETLRQL